MLGQLFSTEYHLLIATEPLMEVWYLLITEKFLFLNFLGGGGRWGWIPSFFKTESWWKDDIYWSLKSSCFELFRNEKCGLYLRQNVDGKMIFTGYWKVLIFSFFGDRKYGLYFSQKVILKIMLSWSFWAFRDIPGPEKYGFLCSVSRGEFFTQT